MTNKMMRASNPHQPLFAVASIKRKRQDNNSCFFTLSYYMKYVPIGMTFQTIILLRTEKQFYEKIGKEHFPKKIENTAKRNLEY